MWRSQVYKDWYRRSGNVHTFCNAYTPLRYLILATSSRQPYLVSRPIAWSTNVERWKETRRRLSITLREETSREEGKKEETSGEGGSIRRRLYLYKRPTRFWKVFDIFVENVQRDDWIRFCDTLKIIDICWEYLRRFERILINNRCACKNSFEQIYANFKIMCFFTSQRGKVKRRNYLYYIYSKHDVNTCVHEYSDSVL